LLPEVQVNALGDVEGQIPFHTTARDKSLGGREIAYGVYSKNVSKKSASESASEWVMNE